MFKQQQLAKTQKADALHEIPTRAFEILPFENLTNFLNRPTDIEESSRTTRTNKGSQNIITKEVRHKTLQEDLYSQEANPDSLEADPSQL